MILDLRLHRKPKLWGSTNLLKTMKKILMYQFLSQVNLLKIMKKNFNVSVFVLRQFTEDYEKNLDTSIFVLCHDINFWGTRCFVLLFLIKTPDKFQQMKSSFNSFFSPHIKDSMAGGKGFKTVCKEGKITGWNLLRGVSRTTRKHVYFTQHFLFRDWKGKIFRGSNVSW